MRLETSVVACLVLALIVGQCECGDVVKVSPARLEYGKRANFTIDLDLSYKFTTQFDIGAYFVGWNGQYYDEYTRIRKLMRFTTPHCSAIGDVTIVDCDAIRMQFKIIARNLWNVGHFTGPFSMSQITFKRPSKVEIINNAAISLTNVNVTLNEGEPFQMTCLLVGGWNHQLTFRWYATTERSPTPDAQIDPNSYSYRVKSSWNSFGYYTYNGSILQTSGIQVRDRGEYYCEAEYKPASVGTFRSQIVRIYVPGELPPENDWVRALAIGGGVALVAILTVVGVSIVIWYKCCRGKNADKCATSQIYELVPDN